MSNNPLDDAIGWTGQAPAQDLHTFAAQLNQCNFVRSLGEEYVVLRRRNDDGILEPYLLRRPINNHDWKPTESEIEATRAVIARHVSDPYLTQADFNRMCASGIITRQVEREMQENAARGRADPDRMSA